MVLTDDNFLLYAMHNYDNPQCHSVQEFEEDLKRFLYLKKLFSRYKANGELRERLILNHIIVLYNLFGDSTTNMLFHKIDKEHWSSLATFLIYIERMPEKIEQHSIESSQLGVDEKIVSVLRKI
jgi:hypothetical protein